jgi:diguanylate cyclase (GGDEF)-like protein
MDSRISASRTRLHSFAEETIETSPNDIAFAHSEREAAFEQELLQLFQQRIHLLASLALLIIPFFALFHAIFSPQTRMAVGLTHLVLVLLCAVVRVLSLQVPSLRAVRTLTLATYLVFACGTALVAVQTAASRDTTLINQFIVYGSFNEIMLSVLLLPLATWECAILALIVFGAMLGSSYFALPQGAQVFYFSHLFVLSTTAFVVGIIVHLQNLQRRETFEATFDLARTAAQLEQLSTRDALTGGYNRHFLERMVQSEIARSARFHHNLSLLIFDLDNFKIVNDTLGHAAGDVVLRQVYATVVNEVREVDCVARYGGDEFVVVLPETTNEAARAIAERMQSTVREQLRAQYQAEDIAARVTISIGLVTLEAGNTGSFRSLIERADEQLYAAKRAGKNRIFG